MLINFGAEYPPVNAMVSRAGPHHYDRALARLHYYKAISSEAYLLATPDPLESAFEAGEKIKAFEKIQIPSLRKDYGRIKANLDHFASKLLMKGEGTEEIRLLLSGGGADVRRGTRLKRTGLDQPLLGSVYSATIPKRVQSAMKLEYKQVSSMPKVIHSRHTSFK